MRKSNFSKVAGVTLLTALMLAACVPQPVEETMVTVETTTSAQRMVNPITEYASIEEINELVGCKLGGPGVMGVTDQSYCVISTDQPIAQYSFSMNGNNCTMRAGKTTEDISGVYYSGKTLGVLLDAQVGSGMDGMLETADGKYARWFDGDMQYSFYMDKSEAMTMETFAGCVDELKVITGVTQNTNLAEKPEIVSETRELTLCKEGVEEPVILYRYEIVTVADEGYDALKKALEEHSAELEKRMQADYDASVKDRQEIEQQAGENYGLQWVMEEHLEITRLDDCMLSGYETYYQYMGGAHPGTIRVGVNYDVATGEKLELADVVEDYDALYQKVLDYLENDFEYREGLFPDYKDTVKKFFYPEENAEYPYTLQWYLTEGSLVIYFNEYDIGPYAMGPVAVEIPFEVGYGNR